MACTLAKVVRILVLYNEDADDGLFLFLHCIREPMRFRPTAPAIVARPASPLPPNVPTGPRNQNKYKDRDGNAPAVDGLDYGGDRVGGTRTPSGEPEERSSSR